MKTAHIPVLFFSLLIQACTGSRNEPDVVKGSVEKVLVKHGYRGPGAMEPGRADSLWRVTNQGKVLKALVLDAGVDDFAKLVAAEMLFEKDSLWMDEKAKKILAVVYPKMLQQRNGLFHSCGDPYAAGKLYGPGKHLVGLGKDIVPQLVPLLCDHTLLSFSMCSKQRWDLCVRHMAAMYIGMIINYPYVDNPDYGGWLNNSDSLVEALKTTYLCKEYPCCSRELFVHEINGYVVYVETRDHLNDSVFVDRTWSHSGKELVQTDTFKVVGHTWSYKVKGQYCAFFSPQAFASGKIIRKYYDCDEKSYGPYDFDIEHLVPVKTETVEGRTRYLYEQYYTAADDTFENCFCCQLHFDPVVGITDYYQEICDHIIVRKVNDLPAGWHLNMGLHRAGSKQDL